MRFVTASEVTGRTGVSLLGPDAVWMSMQVLTPPSNSVESGFASRPQLPVMLGLLTAVGSPKESEEIKEFVAEYASELKDLTFNSKALITTLTMIASENKKAGPSLAVAIERHILLVSLASCSAVELLRASCAIITC